MVQMSGKRALLEQLVADGVRHVFGNPGTTEQPFMDLLQEYPQLEFILCLHESVAVSMADTYARATGKPAFVELHIAPGLGNAGGMLHNAYHGRTPLVVYVGQGASRAMFQEPHLSGDLVSLARPQTKWAYEVHHAADVPQALRRAFKVAEEAPRGPVMLSIPIDVMDEEAEVTVQPTEYTHWRVHPDPAAVDQAVDLLRRGSRPALLIGDGVALCNAQDQVARLAELLGAPIYESYPSETNVATDHPLYRGPLAFIDAEATRAMLAQHDTLLAVGTQLFRIVFPDPAGIVPPGMRIVHVDIDSWELGKNVPGVLSIKADARAALAALAERLASHQVPGALDRAEAIAADRRERHEKLLIQDRRVWDETPISVPRLMGELADLLPPDAAVFDESNTAGAILTRHVKPKVAQYFRARSGGLGPGLPGAIGLKLAMPDRPVVGVVSDGAAMYTINALWTASHHRIPVTWVICNNASYRILKLNMMDYLGRAHVNREFVAFDLTDPLLRFDQMAEGMGVHGRRVENPGDLRRALQEALTLGEPALVDVVVQGSVR